jgi:hypothetical protein
MSAAEKVSFAGWPNCYRLANGQIELIATTDVGPRVARLGFVGGKNLFAEFKEQQGKLAGDDWRIYGGHRLWHAPENPVRTYEPDNDPVMPEQIEGGIRLKQMVERTTGIEKVIEITLDAGANHVHLSHRLTNHNLWGVYLAPWSISVMAPTGAVIIPLPPRGRHEDNLLPANMLSMWAYTDMSDPRWLWGHKFIMLRQDPQAEFPQKVGVQNRDGWAAYALGDDLFVKRFGYVPGAVYPDMGCNFETFTNHQMLEVESLGPMLTLEPGATVEHVEDWYLFQGVPQPHTEVEIEQNVLPKVKSVIG